MTRDSTVLNICSLDSAISYCSFKDGKHQLRVHASDITVRDRKVTSKNKKAESFLAPSEEDVLVSRM